MKFSETLEASPIPAAWECAARYEPSLLIGEARRPRRMLPSLALGVGLGCAAGCVLALLLPARAAPVLPLALTLGVSAALLMALGAVQEARQRAVRASSQLRHREPAAGAALARERPAPHRSVPHFDGVREVEVVTRRGGRSALRVEYLPAPDATDTRTEAPVDNVPAEVETLRRVWRLLHNSFGLRARGSAS